MTFSDPPPVINLILSVGAQETNLSCRNNLQKSSQNITTQSEPQRFEIFAAGLSHEIFGPIREKDEGLWGDLVCRSGVEDVLKPGKDEAALDVVRSMMPCSRKHEAHWGKFFPLGDAKVSHEDVYGGPSDSE